MLKNIKLILFDLDGVLINSKQNMHLSWNAVLKKHKLKISFTKYFKNIGIPFKKILQKLGINKMLHNSIELTYSKNSIKYLNKIKLYPNTKKLINSLKKKGIKIGVVTSKDRKRTLKLVKKFRLNIKHISCPDSKLRGKPYPDQLLNILKKKKINAKEAIYVGDMKVDYHAALRAKISFIFASYGYGKKFPMYKYMISDLNNLLKYI